jgi:para-nitrobenzyl esterase
MPVSKPGLIFGLFLLLVSSPLNSMAGDETLRQSAAGPIEGLVDANGSLSWRGIPYAQPPVGKLRWKAPRAIEPFNKTFSATQFGDMCPQLGTPLLDIDPALHGKAVGAEDCLTLNIWSPPTRAITGQNSSPFPVMVWLHGGSNVGGGSSLYYGGNLALQQKVVVVTINYRLGLLGFFSHPSLREAAESELDRSANFGILDIVHSLKWIRENIAAFGGDPSNVTLFGESAGAMNTVALLYSPLAKGLFHKAIAQSGSLRQTPVEVAEQLTQDDRSEFSSGETAAKFLLNRGAAETLEQARAKVAKLDDPAFLKLMRSASDTELIGTYTLDIGARIRLPQCIPDGIVIPGGSPWEWIADPRQVHNVPVMLGSNRDEMKFFLGLNPAYVTIVPGSSIQIHDVQRYNLHAGYLSDRWTSLGVDELALRLSAHNPAVYTYRFDWDEQPSYPQADFKEFFGAAHSMEIPFVFNDFDGMKAFAYHFTEENRSEREHLASKMGEYWAEFAYTGNPGKGRSGTLPQWPPWGAGAKQLLDAESDGGVRPYAGVLTMKSIHERFLADESFASPEEKAAVYQAMFRGREAWESYFRPQLEE